MEINTNRKIIIQINKTGEAWAYVQMSAHVARKELMVKKEINKDKTWFASRDETSKEIKSLEIEKTRAITNAGSQHSVGGHSALAIVPISSDALVVASSGALVVVPSGALVVAPSDTALVPSETIGGTVALSAKKPKMTHAQKLAKKYDDSQRKEAQGKFDRKKKGGIETLPVKTNVSTYQQRLSNIMHMERNLDTLLSKGKPTFKDHRSDMLFDDLRKCNAGSGS